MLIIGLLGGFAGGFFVGQRMAPPSPPRTVEVPRPAPVGTTAPSEPLVAPPAAPLVETPVDVSEPEVQPPPQGAGTSDVGRALSGSPRGPDKVRATEIRSAATLRFDSRPSGATVYLDGVRVGVTPMTMDDVMPGRHRVLMEAAGRHVWTTTVTVEAGAQLFVGGSLE